MNAKDMSNDMDLTNLHRHLYRMLLDFDALCKKHGIEYWIDAGTLLGAVRHGGFIPWDDDIDICMNRENYGRFLSLSQQDFPDGQYLVRPYEGYYSWAKYCDRRVRVDEVWGGKSDLFIDVFPFELYKRHYAFSKLRWGLAYLARRKRFLQKSPLKLNWKQKILAVLPVETIESVFGIKTATADNRDAGYRVGKECMYFEKRFLAPEVIFPLAEVKFKDAFFPCPRDLHTYLTRFYGDYMKIPEDRSGHFTKVEETQDAV
jgi:lipopolysaccharide cholinephosphotransferase